MRLPLSFVALLLTLTCVRAGKKARSRSLARARSLSSLSSASSSPRVSVSVPPNTVSSSSSTTSSSSSTVSSAAPSRFVLPAPVPSLPPQFIDAMLSEGEDASPFAGLDARALLSLAAMIRTWSHIEEEATSSSTTSAARTFVSGPLETDYIRGDRAYFANLVNIWNAADRDKSAATDAAGPSTPNPHAIADDQFSDPGSADFPLGPSGMAGAILLEGSSSSGLNVSDDEAHTPGVHYTIDLPSDSGGTSYHTAPNTPATPASPADPPEEYRHPGSPDQHVHIEGPDAPTGIASEDLSASALPEYARAASIDNLTTISMLLPSTRYNVRCWQYPRDRHISPVFPNPGDCISAIQLMLHGDKVNAPMAFSRKWGFGVAHRWVWNTCAVVIQIVDNEAVVTTSLSKIADVVKLIVQHCIDLDTDYRGGLFKLGEMYVTVSGRVPGGAGERTAPIGSESYAGLG